MVRAMQSVLCWTLRQEIMVRTAPDLLTSTIALLSPLKETSLADEWDLEGPAGPDHV
jgi:hypothetical protein